jgi:hypothetical protein
MVRVLQQTMRRSGIHAPGQQSASRSQPQRTTLVTNVHRLQHTAGNRTAHRLLQLGTVQAKLAVSHPNDEYEREADRVSSEVMRMTDRPVVTERAPSQIRRQCSACEKETEEKADLVQAKRDASTSPALSASPLRIRRFTDQSQPVHLARPR